MKTPKLNLVAGIAIIILCMTGFEKANAQEPVPQEQTKPKFSSLKFLITGDAFTGLRLVHDSKNSSNSFTFTTTGFNPVFLWKISDKMIFESEVEFQLRTGTGYAAGEGLEVELEYCNIGYILNKYMILRAGTFSRQWEYLKIGTTSVSLIK